MNRKEEPIVFYPFLFAVLPPIYLFAHNIKEATLGHVILPILIPISTAAFFWLLISKTSLSKYKRGFFLFLLMMLFYYFGDLFDFFKIVLSGYDFDSFRQYHLLIPVLGILGWIYLLIKKSKRSYRPATRILNVSIAFLLVFNLMTIAIFGTKSFLVSQKFKQSSRAMVKDVVIAPNRLYPDIYYIILDEYASSQTMKELFGYDNSPFTDRLKERGFLLSKNSRTRFSQTVQCMSTVLNMEYWSRIKINSS